MLQETWISPWFFLFGQHYLEIDFKFCQTPTLISVNNEIKALEGGKFFLTMMGNHGCQTWYHCCWTWKKMKKTTLNFLWNLYEWLCRYSQIMKWDNGKNWFIIIVMATGHPSRRSVKYTKITSSEVKCYWHKYILSISFCDAQFSSWNQVGIIWGPQH